MKIVEPRLGVDARVFHCAMCDGDARWRIDRYGDAVVSWACEEHLSHECDRLQRLWEETELTIRLNSFHGVGL